MAKDPQVSVAMSAFISAGEAGRRIGIPSRKVTAIYERGFLPAPPRFAGHRLIPVADLAKLKAAAKEAGYLG